MQTGQIALYTQPGATTGMKVTALVSGLALLGVGQTGIARPWVARLSGASLLGLGLYWLFASPTPEPQ